MLGLVFAFLTALFRSLRDVISKKGLLSIDPVLLGWAVKLTTFFLLLPLLLFRGIPPLDPKFLPTLLIASIIGATGVVLYLKALQAGDLSLTVPLLSLTLPLLLVTSFLMLGEFPGMLGVFGVLLVASGSYALNISERKRGWFAPFSALLKERGPRLMFIVAILWAINSNFDKIAVQTSSPVFYTVAINGTIALFLTPFALRKMHGFHHLTSHARYILPLSALAGLGILAQFAALNLTLVAYVISIKRTSILFAVIFGYFFFKEKNIKERLLGASLMVVGIFLIALS